MKTKSFWKRTNRGFIVSMVLLAGVILYVLVTQLMLLSDKQALRALAGDVRSLYEETQVLSDEQITALETENAQKAERDRIKGKLEAYFDKESAYLDGAAQKLMDTYVYRAGGEERITGLSYQGDKKSRFNCSIDGDTATLDVTYEYVATGLFYDYSKGYVEINGEPQKPDLVEGKQNQSFYLILTCKKIDGEWKIYRISDIGSYSRGDIQVEVIG